VVVEEPEKVRSLGGVWETVGVVMGFGGIEIVKPGEKGGDDEHGSSTRVVGRGKTVASVKRQVRALTGGWWVGPRMVERIYILRRVDDGTRRAVAVEAR
jgi:alpha-1,6-mannosyltransferase